MTWEKSVCDNLAGLFVYKQSHQKRFITLETLVGHHLNVVSLSCSFHFCSYFFTCQSTVENCLKVHWTLLSFNSLSCLTLPNGITHCSYETGQLLPHSAALQIVTWKMHKIRLHRLTMSADMTFVWSHSCPPNDYFFTERERNLRTTLARFDQRPDWIFHYIITVFRRYPILVIY